MNQARMTAVMAVFAVLAAACSGGGGSGDSRPTPMTVQGVVHGGQAPIVGSTVTLYVASQQPLSPATTLGNPVTTDANGNFTFNSFTCPSPSSELYITSTGGNPGGGVNSAIHLMAILGQCQNLHHSVIVNELTTVAAAYTINGFIGPSGCVDCSGGLPQGIDNISGTNPGLSNAMSNAALLVSTDTGLVSAALPTAADCGAGNPLPNCVSMRKLNAVADALAACVNSSGPTSSQCAQLFECTTPGGAFYSATTCSVPAGAASPTDTLQAVLSAARNPASTSGTGIDYIAQRDAVFSPVDVIAHPTDLTISLNFTGAEFGQLQDLAIDAGGNVWVTNYDDAGNVGDGGTVVKLSPQGALLGKFSTNPATGTYAFGVAIDGSDNVWVGNFTNTTNSLTVLNQSGTPIDSTPLANGSGGLNSPLGVAISPLNYPNGNVWVVDGLGPLSSQPGSLSEFNYLASPFGSGYSLGTTDQYPVRAAVDTNGYVWVTSNNAGSVQQVSPSGAVLNTLTSGGIASPYGVAVDANNNIWVGNAPNGNPSSLTKFNVSNENVINASNYTGGGLNGPQALAIDAAGNVWVANNTSSTISEFNSSGVAITKSTGYSGAGPYNPTGIGVDPSGNVWVSNFAGGNQSVTVFFGVAAPTVTPKVTALATGFVP